MVEILTGAVQILTPSHAHDSRWVVKNNGCDFFLDKISPNGVFKKWVVPVDFVGFSIMYGFCLLLFCFWTNLSQNNFGKDTLYEDIQPNTTFYVTSIFRKVFPDKVIFNQFVWNFSFRSDDNILAVMYWYNNTEWSKATVTNPSQMEV